MRAVAAARRRTVVAAALGVLALAGCSGGDGLPQTQGANYIEGDGTVVSTPVEERGEPVDFTGTTVDGAQLRLSDHRGEVVVLNTWFAGCSPCRKEAPDLQAVWSEYAERGVQFVGINTDDTAEVAASFQRTFAITYPSVLDAGSGQAVLALRRYAPQATPTTLVLDAEGRVAARASGIVRAATLRGMLDDAGALPAPQGSTAEQPAEQPAQQPAEQPA
ncbi:TlpA family protein disulfide reductase [Kineococcus sp. SYSU DK006]|uniref:TlpA family protein disulfide reductase n=1 Tax=Kineococcus sp. SYSU DK006 TaxID=3383127 RepID=UPI003D7D3C36